MLAIETNFTKYGDFGPKQVTINPVMLQSTLCNAKHQFGQVPFSKTNVEMKEQEGESLDDIMNEFEEAELQMQTSTNDESDGEYEEIDDFDSEFSVFGSEKVVERKNSVLGKRNRGEEQISCNPFNVAALQGKWK